MEYHHQLLSEAWVPTIKVLEQKKKKNVYLCKPKFYYIKVGFKGVFITQTCLHDVVVYKYVRKLHFMSPLTRRRKTKFPMLYPMIPTTPTPI